MRTTCYRWNTSLQIALVFFLSCISVSLWATPEMDEIPDAAEEVQWNDGFGPDHEHEIDYNLFWPPDLIPHPHPIWDQPKPNEPTLA